jgi:1-acyl-sn-glycerol-3-phosphate acyltransferase
MSNDSCAPRERTSAMNPDPRRTWGNAGEVGRETGSALPQRVTGLHTRIVRLTRLLILLLRLYLDARLRVPGLPAEHRRRAAQRWARRMLRTLRVEVRARGHVPAPGAPLLLVANHVSWLDSYALNTVSAARFVAKSEVCGWPLIGPIAVGFGTFFLKRGCYRAAARMVGGLAEVLCAAQPVGVFPEGTTSEGNGLLRFYPAMFQAAVLSGARVQPVAVRYRGADGAPTGAAAYVGDMSVLDSIRRLLREPGLTAELVFCAPLDPSGRTRRELAALTRAAIAAALAFEDAVGPTTLRRAA